MLKQARGKPDQTRSIPRKGYICRTAVAGDGGGIGDLGHGLQIKKMEALKREDIAKRPISM